MRYLVRVIMMIGVMFVTGCAGAGVKISGTVTYSSADTSVSIRFDQ
jgi:hypothetical protein